jgi:tetratricopeptide (TPR) repeat protein
MMTSLSRRAAGLPRIPLAILLLTIAAVTAGQLLALRPMAPATPVAPVEEAPAGDIGDIPAGDTDPLAPVVTSVSASDLDRIRANTTFWGDRFRANPRDFVSATRLAASEIELARATGDIGAYLAADAAVTGALAADADYPPAVAYRGVVLVALHRFVDAKAHATTVLADLPNDPTALATLGDASLELGDVTAAAGAYQTLKLVADSAAARVRLSHLAFIQGRTDDAVAESRAAIAAGTDEGSIGSAMAWFHYQLGDTLIATGDRAGAATAYTAALTDDPSSHLARWGLARIAAAEGRTDDAIRLLSEAIAAVPLPEFLARRAELYEIRAAPGDAGLGADDRATVLAIAQLSGEAAGVYDRTLSLFLADTAQDPAKALTLAEAEFRDRRDVYGYDALAWALLANDRPEEAEDAMTTALAFGTRDAKLLYHAGLIKAALVGDDPSAATEARKFLEDALALDPSFDPAGAMRARATLARLP